MKTYPNLNEASQLKAKQESLQFLEDMIQLRLSYQVDLEFIDYAQLLKSEPSRLHKQIIFNEDGTINERFTPFYMPIGILPKH